MFKAILIIPFLNFELKYPNLLANDVRGEPGEFITPASHYTSTIYWKRTLMRQFLYLKGFWFFHCFMKLLWIVNWYSQESLSNRRLSDIFLSLSLPRRLRLFRNLKYVHLDIWKSKISGKLQGTIDYELFYLYAQKPRNFCTFRWKNKAVNHVYFDNVVKNMLRKPLKSRWNTSTMKL